jgi:hypothetical protein
MPGKRHRIKNAKEANRFPSFDVLESLPARGATGEGVFHFFSDGPHRLEELGPQRGARLQQKPFWLSSRHLAS